MGSLRCPYCHDPLEAAAGGWTACAGCLARHHTACWHEHGRCGACGEQRALVRARSPAPRRAAALGTGLHALLLVLTLVAAGHGGVTRWHADRDLLSFGLDRGRSVERRQHVVRGPGNVETFVDGDDWLVCWRVGGEEDAPVRAAIFGVDVPLGRVTADGVELPPRGCRHDARPVPLRPYAVLMVVEGLGPVPMRVDVDELGYVIGCLRQLGGGVALRDLRERL